MPRQPFLFGFPSKGRLRAQALDFFAARGAALPQNPNGRGYGVALPGAPGARVVLLPAAEIAHRLGQGQLHIGLTGADLIRESVPRWQDRLAVIETYDFAAADLIVAVPASWRDVRGIEDLDEVAYDIKHHHGRRLRVATKYPRLARDFFSRKGVIDYRLIESFGATEAAPVAGAADIIVDIASTGRTLKANHLKPLEDKEGRRLSILSSTAVLYAARGADWRACQKTAQRVLDILRVSAPVRDLMRPQ